MKHRMKAQKYIRYADDFVIFSAERDYLLCILPLISDFLRKRLILELHPKKVSINTSASGIDFLGWIHFPDYRIPRHATIRRMWKRIIDDFSKETFASYRGLLSHGNTFGLQNDLSNFTWLFHDTRKSII